MPIATTIPARLSALSWARAHVYVRENPPGSNRGAEIDAWNRAANGLVGEPWCMSFMHAAFAQADVTLGGWAGVQNFLQWATKHGYTITRPFKGDLVCFDWNNDRWYDHVGIVDKVLSLGPTGKGPYYIRTVEGNVADAVRVKQRLAVGAKFVRIPG